jgi:hypothetical protein
VITLSTSARNAKLNGFRQAIDAAGRAAKLCIYSGIRPSRGGAPTRLLVELQLAYPCGDEAKDGRLSLDPLKAADSVSDGKATWARISDGEGGFVADLSVGGPGSGAEIELNTEDAEIVEGIEVVIPSLVFVEPE